ncbi:MAG: polymer-forming cytoskeletal protein [Myxococcota bacterium]|nr:polymer-forming cytoskeletal protein [Myxococcota bacterium]MDW8360918.1 polymer-forming cytoskeletal protein [Myxococcales bacterium]
MIGASAPSVLPAGVSLVGDVSGEEDLVVLGNIEGEVQLGGQLLVETGGSVRGNVRARVVTIRGTLVGDATATESFRVEEGGSMVGDVHAPRVRVARGARFRGHVHMPTEGEGTEARVRPGVSWPTRIEASEAAAGPFEAVTTSPGSAFSSIPTLRGWAAPTDEAPIRRAPPIVVPRIGRACGRLRQDRVASGG